ncbi:MAG TPA: DUF4037 domain-containing protein [Streptosporangiaceae bacterium]|nr:DUF4037 domain-containing protein [Streptosporangiaceae bacterium]
MTGPDAAPNETNIHAAWRMAVARRAAAVYTQNPKLAALTVAGSVGAGLADQFSDLELDCYWSAPPDDRDRTGPVQTLGGTLAALWEYDPDEEEWSEDYRLGNLDVTVSNFLTGTVERFLDQVTGQADTDPVKHMRLAAVQRSHPLAGQPLIASWRERADQYPDRLVAAMVERSLNPAVLTGWAARQALVRRGDDLAVRALLSRVGYAVAGAVLALNRVYLPHRQLKWQRPLLSGLAVAPAQLPERLGRLSAPQTADALQAAESLLTETAQLAETNSDADLGSFRTELSERRRAVDPPSNH